jgi:hypothetical protein
MAMETCLFQSQGVGCSRKHESPPPVSEALSDPGRLGLPEHFRYCLISAPDPRPFDLPTSQTRCHFHLVQ